MSLGSALNSSVSALVAQSAVLSSVAENISNSSTTAYKSSGVSFSDLVTGNGSSSNTSTGTVTYKTYQNLTSQGPIESSDSSTNIAISGSGFFVVTSETDNTPSAYNYSRNGSFSADADGYLINSEGYYLLGWATDADGNVIATNRTDLNSLSVINTASVSGSAKATGDVTISSANLPADADINDVFTTAFEVYDSLGVSHTVDMTWTKTAANTWTLDLSNPYPTGDSSTTSGALTPSTITLNFDGNGALTSTSPDPVSLSITGFTSGATNSAITLDLDNLTQYSSNSTDPAIESFVVDQDGVRYGKLSSIEIDDTGLVTALFDNGLRQPIYQIPIATFSNPSGLTHVNGTVYDENQSAGNYTLRMPGDGNAGTISASSLEGSTTDTSTEFNRMIVAQQAYSAAAEVVSTVTSMFDTLINAVR